VKKLGGTPFGHRCVEVTNIAAIADFLWQLDVIWTIACYHYSWKLELCGKSAVSLLYGYCLLSMPRPTRQAWLEQFSLQLLFILIPILNPLTGGRGLWSSIYHEQWTVA
jgi:hypothetical protein